MGSFLWPFLNLAQTNEMKKIQNSEIDLIKNMKPKCLCLEDMAMDELSFTKVVKLPWFCKKHPKRSMEFKRRNVFKILLTGGGTKSLINELILIFNSLKSHKNIITFVDEKISNRLNKLNISHNRFSFNKSDFLVKLIIFKMLS